MIKNLNAISIIISTIAIILSLIFAIYVNKKYPLIQTNISSCEINDLSCQSEYDISVSGLPTKVGICNDMINCVKYPKTSLLSNVNIDSSSFESQLSEYNSYVNLLSEIGCYTVDGSVINKYLPAKKDFTCPSDINICCKGQLAVCATINIMLSCSNYNVYSGIAYFFTTKMCKILPTCFDNNDSQPYLLSSIPEFSVKLWTKSSKLSCNKIDIDKTNIKKPLGILAGTAGGMLLDKTQAVIYFLSLPQFSKIRYLSFVPYLVASGRFTGMFPNDITFNSLNDGLNMWDIYNRLTEDQKNIWNNGELNIILIFTHNKNIANDIKTRYELIKNLIPNDILNNSDIFSKNDLNNKFNVPIFCVPLPAGNNSKYGNVNDPLGRPMFKNGPNKFITEDSHLYDYEKDLVLLLGRCSFKDGYDDDFNDWKNKINTQANIVVLGVENCKLDYEPFELSDQNGYFIKPNDDYTWVGGNEYLKSLDSKSPPIYQDIYNWKIQDDYTDCYKDDSKYNVNTVMENIENEMKKFNYTVSRNIQVNSSPSPFPYYNEKYPDLDWSQSGSDMLQFNVGTFGDNRDTFYPSSVAFCLGKYDVGVIVSQNYMNRSDCINSNDSDDGIPIGVGSNTLNIYDQTNQTSFGSQSGDRGKAIGEKVYSMAFSRSDLTCPGNLPDDISSFVFIPTGPHNSLSAPENTTFVAMSRTYLYNTKSTNFYCTSPKAKTIPKFFVKIFSPCKDKQQNPLVCNNISSSNEDSCINNDDNSVCPNDLTVQSTKQSKTFDTLTTDICTPLRYNKTATKATLGSFIAVFFVLLLLMVLILTPIFIKLPNTRPYIKLVTPIFLFIIILLTIVSIRLTQFNNSTAYIVNESRKQDNLSNLSDDKSGPLRLF